MKASVQGIVSFAMVFACLIFFASPAPLQADDWNHETTIMMNQPVELPGLLLSANTKYVLKMTGVAGSRNLIQVFNANKTKVLATFSVLSDIRLDSKNQAVFTFIETRAGHPDAIHSWFFPDSLTGVEFLYPRAQAQKIVAHALEPLKAEPAVEASLERLQTTPVNAETPGHHHYGRTNTGRK